MSHRSPALTRKILAGLSASALAFGAVACNSDGSTDAASPASASQEAGADSSADSSAKDEEGQWPRTIHTLDGQGNPKDVTLEKAPENIASTSVTLTGQLLALDAPVTSTGVQSKGNAIADDKGFFVQWAPEAEEKNLEVSYEGEPNVEAILAQNPDLVVMSSAGQDSAVKVYDQLADVVPVVVVDYSNKQWEEVLEELGEATGKEKEATEAVESYHKRVDEVSKKIKAPEQPVNIVSLGKGGESINVWTKESAQGRLFSDLGWEVAAPDKQYGGANPQFNGRADVVSVAAENFAPALTGKSILGINADGKKSPADFIKSQQQLADNEAVANDRVYDLEAYVFRIDYFSAMKTLDDIEKLFAA